MKMKPERCLVIVIFMGFAASAHAGRYVSPAGTHTFPYDTWHKAARDIQSAVDAAPVGATVWLDAGTYTSAAAQVVLIDKSLSLRGRPGTMREEIIIDGGGGAHGNRRGIVANLPVETPPPLLVIEGLTVSNCYFETSGDSTGAGLRLLHDSVTAGTAMVNNCVIINNHGVRTDGSGSGYGGGIYALGADGSDFHVIISDTLILDNSTTGRNTDGGGAYFRYGRITLEHVNIISNHAHGLEVPSVRTASGGGIFFSQVGTDSVIRNCEISHNTALAGGGGSYGGGIAISGNGITIENSVLQNNQAVYVAGIRFNHDSGMGVLRNSLVANNYATAWGGGVAAGDAVLFESSTIVSNRTPGLGAGIHFNGATADIRNTIIYYNHSDGSHSNRYITASTVTWSNSCMAPAQSWPEGNTAEPPLFVSLETGDFRLQVDSPVMDAGTNLVWMDGARDLDGNPRITGGTVDMGCYERPFFDWAATSGVFTNTAMSGTYAVVPVELWQTDLHPTGMVVRLVSTSAWLQSAADVTVPPSNFVYAAQITNSAVGTPWFTVSPAGGVSRGPHERVAGLVEFTGLEEFEEGAYTGQVFVAGSDGMTGGTTQTIAVVTRVLARVPDWLTATEGTDLNGVTLHWRNTRAQKYAVWRAHTPDLSDAERLALVPGIPDGALEYYDDTALPGVQYYYAVRPSNLLGGYGRYSPAAGGWRTLLAPTEITASEGLYTNRVEVSWSAAEHAQTYEIWRSVLDAVPTAARVAAGITGLEWTDYAVEQDREYYYWVRAAVELAGEYSGSARGFSAQLPPPAEVRASRGMYDDKIRVSWPGVSGALRYELWRGSSAAGAMTLITTTRSLGYDDYDVAAGGRRYYYRVQAYGRTARSVLSRAGEGYADIGRAGLSLSDLRLTPGQVRAGGGLRALSVTLENIGPRPLLYPDDNLRFELILAPADGPYNAGRVVWVGKRRLQLAADRTLHVDLMQQFRAIRLPAYLDGVYDVYLRVRHAPPSGLTGADLGANVVQLEQRLTVHRGVAGDFTGDNRADLVLYNAAGRLAVRPIAGGPADEFDLGLPGGVAVSGDFDGDGLADAVMYRAGEWSAVLSDGDQAVTGRLGGPGWQALAGDFDGDGISDPAVYNARSGTWHVLLSAGHALRSRTLISGQFGGPGYMALTGDFDGDGLSDPALYNPETGEWLVYLMGTGELLRGYLGGPGYMALTGDFDGDGVTDVAVYNANTGEWLIYLVGGAELWQGTLGGPGYWPLAGDYDGDGVWDIGVYRQDGRWYLQKLEGEDLLWNWRWGGLDWHPMTP